MFLVRLFFTLAVCFLPFHLQAAITFRDGKIMDARFVATQSAQEHYQAGLQAIECQQWYDAVTQFQIIVHSYPEATFAKDAFYYLGVAYFYLQDYDLADQNLSTYLEVQSHPKNFREVIYYKFAIAEKFSQGARRHLFGVEKFPKWMPSREYALGLFDQVVTALPNDEIAAKALYAKANLLQQMGLYAESIESYQAVIKRFPKSPMAPESYVAIADVYLLQSETKSHDPDLLDLAQINLKRFRQDFPGDDRVEEVEDKLLSMQEWSAQALVDTGKFYERTRHPQASVLYYKTVIHNFPQTRAAEYAERRLEIIIPPRLREDPSACIP